MEHKLLHVMNECVDWVLTSLPRSGVFENVLGWNATTPGHHQSPQAVVASQLTENGYCCQTFELCQSSFVACVRRRSVG